MSRLTRLEAGTTTDPKISVSGGWTAVGDGAASGSSYLYSATAGNTATITIDAGLGVTSVLLVGANTNNNGVATISVNGVVVQTWNQQNYSTAASTWYRTCAAPVVLTPTQSSNGCTIVLTVVSGTVILDAVDRYTTSGVTTGRLTTFGHSIVAGGQGTGTSQVTTASRFGGLLAAALGMVEDNQGVVGEAISNGWPSNTTAGWTRIDTGTLWEARTPEIALLMHGLNDVDNFVHTDPAGGSNYTSSEERYKQRIREPLWRMHANCPGALLVVCGITNTVDVTIPTADKQRWSGFLPGIVAEPTMANVIFVNTYLPMVANGGSALSYFASTPGYDPLHPNLQGHWEIFRAVYREIRNARATASLKVGL